MKNKPNIYFNEFSKKNEIKWHEIYGNYNTFHDKNIGFHLGLFYFCLNSIDNKDFLILSFKKDSSIKKNDIISILLENNIVIKFTIENDLYKSYNYLQTKIRIKYSDLELLEKYFIIKTSINFVKLNHIETTIDLLKEKKEYQELIQKFVSEYKNLVLENIIEYEPLIETKTEYSDSECYLYLMLDTATNLHKIGISNKPFYREKTLQSEKPSIEMISYMKLPLRKFAIVLENTLHNLFKEKRIRGEWFDLSKGDVENIKFMYEKKQ
jgi:hypothetical protein